MVIFQFAMLNYQRVVSDLWVREDEKTTQLTPDISCYFDWAIFNSKLLNYQRVPQKTWHKKGMAKWGMMLLVGPYQFLSELQ